ncbi:hypothetical protein HGRIS_005772 [Hohenbuehelia grisea]|uniref:F-box domain-containing protein n=1 Tax=Hohenbuehelia grisea TaxID=104357 RepID=A0ABR3JYW1_9AGAR
MMRQLTGLPIDDDLVVRILFFCPDFSTLQAFILTSKAIHQVYQRYPKSIVRAVAYNVAGPALPQALRLVRYKLKHAPDAEAPLDEESDSDDPPGESGQKDPLTKEETKALLRVARTAGRLEHIFSWMEKDKTRKHALSPEESWRFRRAIYRVMLYCEIFGPERAYEHPDESPFFAQEDDEVDIDDIRALRRKRKVFLDAFNALELLELHSVLIFLESLLERIHALYHGPSYTGNEHKEIVSMGPDVVLECYDAFSLMPTYTKPWNLDNLHPEAIADFFSGPLELIFDDRKVKQPERQYQPILDEVFGEDDQCQHCKQLGGMSLWGSSNWERLNISIRRQGLLELVKGRLIYNQAHMMQIRDFLTCPDYPKLFNELFDLKLPEYADWDKDDWLCMACLKKFFGDHFHIWFKELKRLEGNPEPSEDCW